MSCIDIGFLRNSILFLIVIVGGCWELLNFSHHFYLQQQTLYQQQTTQKISLADKFASKQQQQHFFAQANPKFKQLQQARHFQKFMPQNSEYWATLETLAQQLNLLPIEIKLVENSKPMHLIKNSEITVYQTTVDLTLSLLHTGDFYQYLSQLNKHYSATRLQIKSCRLQRQSNQQPAMKAINIMANCQLNFHYNIYRFHGWLLIGLTLQTTAFYL